MIVVEREVVVESVMMRRAEELWYEVAEWSCDKDYGCWEEVKIKCKGDFEMIYSKHCAVRAPVVYS
jgi:hypothetical protein